MSGSPETSFGAGLAAASSGRPRDPGNHVRRYVDAIVLKNTTESPKGEEGSSKQYDDTGHAAQR